MGQNSILAKLQNSCSRKTEDSIPKYIYKNLSLPLCSRKQRKWPSKQHSNNVMGHSLQNKSKMSMICNKFPCVSFAQAPLMGNVSRTNSCKFLTLTVLACARPCQRVSDFVSQHYCCQLLESHHGSKDTLNQRLASY